ncbi:MAG TPA: hypothetical protein GX708_01225 [Gallicola sp.]|nr:hypothetical protein [Gallicola sp.]
METFKVYVWMNEKDTDYTELNETNGYDVITPIYLSLRKTSMLDFGLIQFLTENDITIKPFSKCKIEITKNGTTKTLYFYTANNIKTKINETVNQHNLYLIEPTKILERYIIGARAFSKDSFYTPNNKSLIETMLTNWTVRGAPLIVLNTNDRQEFLQPNKDLFLSEQTTLLEALIKVGGRMNAFPRLVDFQTLEFDFYDRNLEEYEIPTDSIYFEAINNTIDTFATSIESYANNILDTDKTMYELDNKHGISVRSETLRITKDTAMIITSRPIYKIRKVWIAPNENTRFRCRYDGNYMDLQAGARIDITNYVYEKREYNMLDYDNSSGATEYQLKALYYESGDNKIQGLFGYHDNWLFQSGEAIEKILLSGARDTGSAVLFPAYGGWAEIINLNVSPANDYLNLEYIIEYETLDDIKVSAYKDRWQQSSLIPNTIIYNQSANIINFNYYGENLQATVDKMANNEFDITLRLKNENIPKLNQCIVVNNKKYNINEIDIESYNTYKKVKIKASNNYNKIAEDIDIDSQLKLFNIPNDNYIVDRIIKLETFIFLNKEYTKNDSDLTKNGKRLIMEALTTYNTTGNSFTPIAQVIVRLNTVFLLPINYLTTTKKAIMSFGFNDNYIGGTQKEDTTDNKGAVNKNTFYTDSNGNLDHCDILIERLVAEENYKPNKLPLNDNYSFPKRLLGTVIPIKKDVREKLKFNYQINILSDNEDLIIGNSFSNNLGLFHKYSDAKKYVYFSTTKLYENFKKVNSNNCNELVNGVATVGLSNSITINRDYTDEYMGEAHNNYLNISITDDLKQLYKAFVIVDENYETIFICNDINIERIYFNFSDYYNE